MLFSWNHMMKCCLKGLKLLIYSLFSLKIPILAQTILCLVVNSLVLDIMLTQNFCQWLEEISSYNAGTSYALVALAHPVTVQ